VLNAANAFNSAFSIQTSALFSMRSFLSIVAAPTLCLGLLGGVVWENQRHVKPMDTNPFHAAAKTAVEHWPRVAGDWVTPDEDSELPAAAIQLLKPNAYFYRVYTRKVGPPSPAGLLVVQCRHPDDMSGHYPPNCYPRSGKATKLERRHEWTIPGLEKPIVVMEYHFEGGSVLRPESTVVYDFFVLPGRGMVGDMAAVRDASGDYQRRHFGAAQIQVIFNDPKMEEATREAAFKELMKAGVPALRALNPPGV
jgi:hypothetical protein